MCGIVGIYFFQKTQVVNQEILANAVNTLYHRGPDGSGVYTNHNIGLGHRRLSIIDLSAGSQPMFNEDGSVVTVYNGEIYNHDDLRERLNSRHEFRTRCDTEVLVHGYEEWGTGCIEKLNGMFAFAVWDDRNQTLLIARDRMGIKPLYYVATPEFFIFASEIKAILVTGLIKPMLNDNALDAYFTVGHVPGPETLFKQVMKLLPGHYLKIKDKIISTRTYWDFADIAPSEQNFGQAVKGLESLFYDSVKKQLMSDVPLGAFLSGGIDSSLVVAAMSEMADGPVNTFSVGYDTRYGVSEDQYAKLVADQFETIHWPFQLDPDDFFDSLEKLVHFSEEPIVEPAAIALYHLSCLARKHAIVLLSGEGSDELMAGYFLYHFMTQIHKVQKIVPVKLLSLVDRVLPSMFFSKYQKYIDWLGLPLNERYRGTSTYLTERMKNGLYADDFLMEKGNYLDTVFQGHFNAVKDKRDPLFQLLYVDSKTWLPDRLLLKADKMTMAASIELRVPFLDHRLVEYCASLPSRFKDRRGDGKYILKAMAADKLPREIIGRKKMGFPVPTRNWFSGALSGALEERLLKTGSFPWFRKGVIKTHLEQHRQGRDHSHFLMTLLVLDTWRERYLG